MSNVNFTLAAWQRLSPWWRGKWLYSKRVCFKASYFSTIHPKFISWHTSYCEIHIKKRCAILNHIATVHAIAMCNLAELAAGTMTDGQYHSPIAGYLKE